MYIVQDINPSLHSLIQQVEPRGVEQVVHTMHQVSIRLLPILLLFREGLEQFQVNGFNYRVLFPLSYNPIHLVQEMVHINYLNHIIWWVRMMEQHGIPSNMWH